MKDTLRCIDRYIYATFDEKFVMHVKELSNRLSAGIRNSYSKNYREENIVKIVEEIINYVGQFKTQSGNLRISTNSIFIHGNRSHVEFEYYGKRTRREFGDIIFILSVVYKGKKYFEKMTINQVKKANKDKKATSITWNFSSQISKTITWKFSSQSSKEQLYLLSRFPIFRGTSGSLIPDKIYNLPNISGCLGSHGLLYSPGDFALISSKELEVIISGKNTLKLNDLVSKMSPNNLYSWLPYILDYYLDYYPPYEIRRLLVDIYSNYLFLYFPHYCICNFPVLINCCISLNVYDFSNKYLRGHIGELIYGSKIPNNKIVFHFLQDLLSAIRRKAERERNNRVLNFVSSFYKFRYNPVGQGGEGYKENVDKDYEGGGIGIIHTIINLGEVE